MSVITKDGITSEQLSALLEYSRSPECQLTFPIMANSKIINHGDFGLRSVIRFLEIKEVSRPTKGLDDRELFRLFDVKICVEDHFWKINPQHNAYERTGNTPPNIKLKVTEILG